MNRLKALDQETIKEINQKKIIQLLYRNKQLTKQEIAQALKVSIPTVINNVNALKELGFLDEAGVGESSGGRKPTIVRFVPDCRYSFGVCITNKEARIILSDLDFNILEDRIIEITDEFDDFATLILEIKEGIEKIIVIRQIPTEKILGIGFSLPGTVDEKKLVLESAPNLKLKNIDFYSFQEKFQLPLFIENEANASASSEAFINFHQSKNNLVFVSITEGIGTGIIIGDSLYKGFNKRAGEFGHMTIVKDGKQCNCGKKGCWELYASEKALVNEFEKFFGTKAKKLSSMSALIASEEKAKVIFDNYVDYLAEGIKNIILMLDPKDIIIGGEIAYYKKIIEKALIAKIFEKNTIYGEECCKISFSSLEGNAPILGAALLPMEKFFFLGDKVN